MEVANGIFVKGKSFHFRRIQENKGASSRQLSIVRFQRLQKKLLIQVSDGIFVKRKYFL